LTFRGALTHNDSAMMTMGGLRMADSGAWKVKATESRIRGRIKYFVIFRRKGVVGWRLSFGDRDPCPGGV